MIGNFNGLTFGTGTQYPVTTISGFDDMPGIKSRDQARAAYDGDVSAPDLTASRTVVIGFGLLGDTPDDMKTLKAALRYATAPQAAPLLLTVDDQAVFAKPRRRSIPDDRSMAWRLGEAAVEFYCADPRVYSANENVVSTGLAVATGGLTFPITFPISFGSAASGGGITAVNNGNANAPIKITYQGQLVNPGSTLDRTGQLLQMTLTTGSTDSLVLDSQTHSVTLNGTVSRRAFLTVDQWFSLPPGTSFVSFTADSAVGSPTMELRWRDSWL